MITMTTGLGVSAEPRVLSSGSIVRFLTAHWTCRASSTRARSYVASNRAKISKSYLKAIEEERFEDLPAPVFIRGFVTEYARFLKIDPHRAVRDFMAKFDAATSKAK